MGLLSSALANGRAGHAYLITGPAQIGKTTLARTFAQAVNCEREAGERPCGSCRTCALIAADRHPDVRLVRPDTNERGTQAIKIDHIRALQQDLSLSAYEGRAKIGILKQFDAANLSAANAFLKTLEEPPPNVVLLLTANDADTLLPTINSRCRTLNLRPLPTALIEETLMTRHHVEPNRANLLAHLADGRIGWAIRAKDHPTMLEERAAQLETLQKALTEGRVARFTLAETLAKKPDALPAMLRTWLSWWRDLALLAFGRHTQPFVTNIDQRERLHELAHAWSKDEVMRGLSRTNQALWQLDHNANTRLALENLFLAYPRAAAGRPTS